MNQVLDEFRAVVDGKTTGLAGCSNDQCDRPCLRRDTVLRKEHDLYQKQGEWCRHYISQAA